MVTVANVGDADADGEADPIVLRTYLPPGLRTESIETEASGNGNVPFECSIDHSISDDGGLVVCPVAEEVPAFGLVEVPSPVLVKDTSHLIATVPDLAHAPVLGAGCAHVGLGVGRFTTSECSEGSARGLGE